MRGDHLRVYRGGYEHHGIDLGDGTVVHFTGVGASKAAAAVRRTSFAEFAQGDAVDVVDYTPGATFHPDSTCLLALSLAAGFAGSPYRLTSNNCEHLAAYCKTGQKRSAQVEEAARRMNAFSRRFPGPYRLLAALASPAVEVAIRAAQHGHHRLTAPRAGLPPERVALGELPPSAEARTYFRRGLEYVGPDGTWYLGGYEGQWLAVDRAGTRVVPRAGRPQLPGARLGERRDDHVLRGDGRVGGRRRGRPARAL